MREVIGQKKHHGRVELAELVQAEHIYAVGALEGLAGEITIFDSSIVATSLSDANSLSPVEAPLPQATLLIGRVAAQWLEFAIESDIAANEFDAYLAEVAGKNEVDLSVPTVFTIEGEFNECCFHVINGACPVHAELHGVEMADNVKPYKTTKPKIRGTLVGVFAKDAAGVITHPGTTTHTHIVFKQTEDSEKLTAHVESTGILAGSVLRFPTEAAKQKDVSR
jgi:alpha-acetolactate decarboxylase